MRGTYGSIHRLSNFIERTLPKRGAQSALFAFPVIAFLQTVDAIIQKNGWIDLTIHTNDGIWILYQGMRFCFVKPGKTSLTLMSGNWSRIAKQLVKLADTKKRAFTDTTRTKEYRSWSMNADGMSALIRFIRQLRSPRADDRLDSSSHPRHFAPELRTLALQAFEREGYMCPGVKQLGRPPHKVDLKRDRIEYDHILPYSRRGTSTANNIQVLCLECNRAKADRP